MARARLTVSFPGLTRASAAFRRAADHADQDTTDATFRLARDTVVSFRQVAPVKTGKLRRGITAKRTVGGAEVTLLALSRSGFSYGPITRFGHRHATPDRIYPTSGKALVFTIGGRKFIRKSVARFHPAHDWSRDATPEVERLADAAVRRLGAKIVGRVA